MKIEKCTKKSFVVIGKMGSTEDGEGFIQKLWKNTTSQFSEIEHLAKRDGDGNFIGIWGAMSDCSLSFKPWEDNFSKGLYLVGIECTDHAEAPENWTKWIVPGYEYLRVECVDMDAFPKMIQYMKENNIELVGAVHDYTCPKTKKNYMFFPIRKL